MKESESKIIAFVHILFMVVIYLDHESILKDEAWAKILILYFIIFNIYIFINKLKKER
jgi:hypothetical protein